MRVVFIALIATALTIVLLFYPLRSYLVMSLYSRYNYGTSVMKDEGFDIDIKGGLYTRERDWYPFVNLYDTSYEFSKHTGEDLSLTVIYNFGAFDGGSSSFYDEESEYFAAFYGAYAIHDNWYPEKAYGFDHGEIDIDEISGVPMFDYKYLVIEDLGCENPVFEILEYEMSEVREYAGYEGWVRIDAKMLSNSPSHTRRESRLGYIQYGRPVNNSKDDFYEIELYGRMYARYFEEFQSTIVIYVMGADKGMTERCDSELLSKTEIYKKE